MTAIELVATAIEEGFGADLPSAKIAANVIALLRIYAPQLTSEELKLVGKHCEWPAFKHAFNSVMKVRLSPTPLARPSTKSRSAR